MHRKRPVHREGLRTDLDKAQKAGKIGSSRHGYLRVFLADKEDLTVQPADPGEVTVLLQQICHGGSHAIDKLLPLVFHELRTLARLQLRNERSDHTLQPTALVNEAYIRLVTDQARNWQSRAHFIGVSASIMRRILVDHAHRRRALKRGGLSRSALDAETAQHFPKNKRRNCSPSTWHSTRWKR